MRIENTLCDICGATIKSDRPLIVEVKKYGIKEGNLNHSYQTIKHLDICDKCLKSIVEKLSGGEG